MELVYPDIHQYSPIQTNHEDCFYAYNTVAKQLATVMSHS
jgi:hypothetical protein